MPVFEGQLDPPRGRFAIVAARFNSTITTRLVDSSRATLLRHDVSEGDIELVWVPGSLEIPMVAQRLAASRRYVAVICLSCVIRGGTDHYRYVAGEAARGIAEAARATGVPVIFGVLTTDTVEQALERTSPTNDAGGRAAEAAIRMANLLAQLPGPQ
ncbi:MAG: 6,7-dimethyl-8-ribityllumazine synthase [Planctomycetes bacterium]|nr:6,7-dimethyl-8-ribityllumazine synthase [Planctomycetota bacterium]